MKLNELPAASPSDSKRKRVGRGPGSQMGKTSTRGQKGQKSRSGGYHKVGFEGGQMPMQRRLPKRGFKNRFRKEYALVNVGDLDGRFDSGAEVTAEQLLGKGKSLSGVKLLANGDVKGSFKITVDKASAAAIAKIEAAGGSVTVTQAAAAEAAAEK